MSESLILKILIQKYFDKYLEMNGIYLLACHRFLAIQPIY